MGKFIFYFAAIGWIVSLIVNLLSNVGIDLSAAKALIFLLHLGALFVVISSFLELNSNEVIEEYQQSRCVYDKIPLSLLKIVLKDTPRWMKKLAVAGVFYGIINVLISLVIQTNSPDFINGQFVLTAHDHVIKIITEQDYHFYRANEIRVFSGIWVLFYGLGATLFYEYSGLTKEKFE
jgi:hypothetical protein